MFENTIYELSMTLSNAKFEEIMEQAQSKSKLISIERDEYVDASLGEKGMLVTYRNKPYKKTIRIAINAGMLSDYKEMSSVELLKKINKIIKKYFNEKHHLNHFEIYKITIIKDINVKSKKKVMEYLHILDRIGRVKSFVRDKYKDLNKKNYFMLKGKSNGVGFMVYDLEERLKWEGVEKSVLKQLNTLLRTEISFSGSKALDKYVKGINASEYIAAVNKKSQKLYMEVFSKVVPVGEFYKKDEAVKLIHKQVKDKVLRRKMIRLVTLIPEKKSLLLAQKAMHCRDMDKVMTAFAKINLSPVTISARQGVKQLGNMYALIK